MTERNEELKLDDSTKLNNQGQPILGKLSGPCADILNPTRNGRLYTDALWKRVFNDEIIKEYFECGGIPGELDHPLDRLETVSEKIAIMMPEPPKEDDEGHLIATFDILDTPNGRIVYTLAKYGYKLGISSRGNGEVYTDSNDVEIVDESTYDFKAFDVVLLPAVKAARLNFTESLNTDKSFKQAICECLKKAEPNDKRIMMETLDNLKIDYNDNNVAVNDVKANIIKQLQESIKENKDLTSQIITLQEKLSVCYAKEAKYEENIEKYKSTIQSLSEKTNTIKSLKSEIKSLNETIESNKIRLNNTNSKNNELIKKQKIGIERQTNLNEALIAKTKEIKQLKESYETKLNTINAQLTEAKNNNVQLKESIENLKSDYDIKNAEYKSKLTKSNNLVEKYKATAKRAVDKYIASQALRLGANATEIKSKLPENYSFSDIDRVCENFQAYSLKLNNLPFNVSIPSNKIKQVTVTENLNVNNVTNTNLIDDDVDDSLLVTAGLKTIV